MSDHHVNPLIYWTDRTIDKPPIAPGVEGDLVSLVDRSRGWMFHNEAWQEILPESKIPHSTPT